MKYPQPSRKHTFDKFGEHVSRGKATMYASFGLDACMGRREGPFFWDAFDDRRWWNCHSNGGVFNLGHHNPTITAAVTEALQHLDIGNHHLVSGYRAQLAERLAATTGGRLSGVVFAVAGGEAIDLAIKVCRGGTGRTKIVSVDGGYHGHTGLALAAGDAQYRDPFGPSAPGFQQVPFDDLGAMEAAVDDDTAAVLLEPVPATLGMPIASDGYLAGVQKICRERGAKLILDEVQTGLGRTGAVWCYHKDDLEPDVVVAGKGLSGGVYPIAATLMTRELHAFFDDRPFIHISTFGGAEPGCVAGLAVLDAIEAPGFLDRVNRHAASFAAGLSSDKLPFELRQNGLMMGLKFPQPKGGLFGAKLMYDAGVFCVWANNDDSVLQFLPPLILDDAQVDELIQQVVAAFP